MRVAVVGAGHRDRLHRLSWRDKTLEVWAVPRIVTRLPRVDRVYELHTGEAAAASASDVHRSKAAVYTWAELPEFHGPIGDTISAMLAHALHLGAEEVQLWGAPMQGRYTGQRDCVFYWIGRLVQAGVRFADHSSLLDWSMKYEWRKAH